MFLPTLQLSHDSGQSTSNILGRVTGGNVSSIFGMIQTTGFEGAIFFLMNPAGFLFGSNATVNIGGMMTFTTADHLTLRELDGGNAGIFHADRTQTSVLTSAPVAAFGFIGSNPNAITFEAGHLTVMEGTGLRLVGGDINLLSDALDTSSTIAAPGRPIEMVSVAGTGEVDAYTGIPSPEMALGAVTLSHGTTLSTLGNLEYSNGDGGAVSIRGGQLVATGTNIFTSPHIESAGHGGEVTITTTGSAAITNLAIDTRSESSTGDGGAVSVAASNLTLQDSSIVTR